MYLKNLLWLMLFAERNVHATRFVVVKSSFMTVTVRSFAKINLGLRIGPLRADGFHELRSVYQTIALHDFLRVRIERGSGIEVRCNDPRVPQDSTNTCWRIVELGMAALKARGRAVIEIDKRLPVQGGLGGASGNAVAALLGLERALGKALSAGDRLRIAAQVGSDLPLFLIGGTVLGVGRGEEVYRLPDLPAVACVIALPEIAVSTPKAFADWDNLYAPECDSERGVKPGDEPAGSLEAGSSRPSDARPLGMTSVESEHELKNSTSSDRMLRFSREISAWLGAAPVAGRRRSGVSAKAKSGGRAENPLLDLVRTGIENDFERVVFPQYPELREVKRVLERAGARYRSLSGSGSTVYGLFESREKAAAAAKKLSQRGSRVVVTSTLTRRQYWNKLLATSS
jgi:4-diphosphocytidyl-2-C-methyl-D-erythritol kinase